MATRSLVRPGTIEIGSETVDYRLLRVARRRHVHLLVTDDATVEVRAPWRYSDAEARDLIREHHPWLLRTLGSALARKRSRPGLTSGALLPLLDERLRLVLVSEAQLDLFAGRDGATGRRHPAAGRGDATLGWVVRRGGALEVHCYAMRQAPVQALLESWFREEASRRLPERLRALASRLGLHPARVTVRAQQTIWGSCTENGSISLNWRLVLLPSTLVDYVLVHELCHLRYLDHSPRFWALVATMIPDHPNRRRQVASWQGRLAL